MTILDALELCYFEKVADSITMVENQFARRTKLIRNDNQIAFRLDDLCRSKDIVDHFICVETSITRMLGLERKHPYILGVAQP